MLYFFLSSILKNDSGLAILLHTILYIHLLQHTHTHTHTHLLATTISVSQQTKHWHNILTTVFIPKCVIDSLRTYVAAGVLRS